nr:hypothetical protein [Tanacetum cinerariifolium]
CIKQFWATVAVKKLNDVTRLQALVDKKKVVITEATIQEVLHLDDAEGAECLPNEEIFAELARMGYKKPSTKLTILQCMSAKRTSWNEFSSSMASTVICLSSGDLSTHTTKYTSPALTQKVFANMRRVGKGFFGVETPLFEGMVVAQEVGEGVADEVHDEGVFAAGVTTEGVVSAAEDVVPTDDDDEELSILLQKVGTGQRIETSDDTIMDDNKASKPQRLKKVGTAQRIETSDDTVMDDVSKQGRMIADMDADVDVTLKDVAKDVHDAKIDESADVLSMQDDEEEPAKIQEVVEVVTTAKLITEVVTAASATITAIAPQLTIAAAPTLTTTLSVAERRKGAVIRNPEEIATPSIIIHSEAKSKDKGKGILVEEPKPFKKQAQIEHDEAYARELEAGLNKNIDWDEVINHVQRKQKEDNVMKKYQALKRKPQTEAQARKNMMIYLRNVAGFKMDYFKGMTYDDMRSIFKNKYQALKRKPQTEAQARKNMMIYLKNVAGFKMDYFKGMSYDDIHPIFEAKFDSNVAFLQKTKKQIDEEERRALNRINETPPEKATKRQKMDEEDLDVLWSLVKERFATTKPKNFSDDFLLITLGVIFGVDATKEFKEKHAKCLMLLVKDLVLSSQDDAVD